MNRQKESPKLEIAKTFFCFSVQIRETGKGKILQMRVFATPKSNRTKKREDVRMLPNTR
jgi:hypothetical protein